MSFIKAEELSKIYDTGGRETLALDRLNLEVKEGEFLAVMGPSGSGKSTLLSILGALNRPSAGSLEMDGIDLLSLKPERQADFRREFLGFVFQNFNLIPYLTLLENVQLPLAVKKLPKAEKREMGIRALERVGLADRLDQLPGEASGGEQERCALARALVNEPPLLLADEPTGNLDTANSNMVMELLAEFNREGMTVLMVTHSRECASQAGRVFAMRDGRADPRGGEICHMLLG